MLSIIYNVSHIALHCSRNETVIHRRQARSRTQENLLCEVQEPGATPLISTRSGSEWDTFFSVSCSQFAYVMLKCFQRPGAQTAPCKYISRCRMFVLTMIPPRIVRIQLKRNVNESIFIQPLKIISHVFRTLRVGERKRMCRCS